MAENGRKLRPDPSLTMAETPEIPAVPAENPPVEAVAPRPEPSGESLGGAVDDQVNNTPISWVDSGSPSVVGSYAASAPTASAEAPAPAEAAPAVFVAGYGAPAPSPAAEEPPARSEPGSAAAPAWSSTTPASESAQTVRPWESANTNRDGDASVSSGGSPAEPVAAVDAVAAVPLASSVAPAPAALAEAPQQPEPPGIATSVLVPPLPAGEAGEGGEWELLRSKVSTWFDGADLQGRWESLGGPLRAAGLLLAAVVLLRLYSALLETLGDLPLVPRLLQLVGLLSLLRFALTRLVRSSERERILTSWTQRWNDFRGRD